MPKLDVRCEMKQWLIMSACALALSGCASKDYVQTQLKPLHEGEAAQNERLRITNTRVDGVAARMGTLDATLTTQGGRLNAAEARLARQGVALAIHDERLNVHDAHIAALAKSTQEALDRATAAGKLAAGKVVYEVVLTDDTLRFSLDKAGLSDRAKKALDAFAARIKADNQGVYVEIQGHTDSTGSTAENDALGLARAQAVQHHLGLKGGLPLHRLAVISYGETAPLADNKQRAGREQNRRVVLVVLR
jgi:peptidoglycan-associated lipoprotein